MLATRVFSHYRVTALPLLAGQYDIFFRIPLPDVPVRLGRPREDSDNGSRFAVGVIRVKHARLSGNWRQMWIYEGFIPWPEFGEHGLVSNDYCICVFDLRERRRPEIIVNRLAGHDEYAISIDYGKHRKIALAKMWCSPRIRLRFRHISFKL